MEKKLTMQFKVGILRKWEKAHNGLSALSILIPYEMFETMFDIMNDISNKKDNQSVVSKTSLLKIYNLVNKFVSTDGLVELIKLGNLDTLSDEQAENKLDNYLEKYPNSGLLGAYIQILKELDNDINYLSDIGINLGDIVGMLKNKVDSLKNNIGVIDQTTKNQEDSIN